MAYLCLHNYLNNLFFFLLFNSTADDMLETPGSEDVFQRVLH